MTIFVTGGHGFIGKNFIKNFLQNSKEKIINIDCLTYAAKEFYHFNYNIKSYKLDIIDKKIKKLLIKYRPRVIINFAAETHVDNSILNSKNFFLTNVLGTLNLLNLTRDYIKNFKLSKFLFIHISTDEVFGSLKKNEKPFTEKSKYNPKNPYSASKASSDHLVKSFINTYKFPAIITNCSNNFGPYQNSEKLIPKVITNAILKKNIPIYGQGKNIRDWIHVDDHCKAILKIMKFGKVGESYNIGSENEISNKKIVFKILEIISSIKKNDFNYLKLVKYVKDRPGHDFRYAINSSKIRRECNWRPDKNFTKQLQSTVKWYLDNENFIIRIRATRKKHL